MKPDRLIPVALYRDGEGWNDATPSELPDWFQVDFAGSKTINEIDVFSLHDNYTEPNTPTETQTFTLYGLVNFEVQYWNGSAWATIPGGSVTGNNKVWRKFSFAPITTNKIRLWISGVPDAWSRLVELQAWSATAGGNAPTSGLKGHWKFDENTGATATDSSGSGNTGTLASGAGWNTGQSGAATSLDGADDYIQVGPQASLVMTTGASFSAWIYPTGPGSLATYGGIIVNKEGEYEIARFADGTIQWAFANSNPGWAWINTGYVAPLNQWTHVTVTYDNGAIKTYANGNLVHTYNGAGSIGDVDGSQNDFRIGGRQAVSQNFNGRVDEVRVYNRALTSSEVSTLLTGGGGGGSSANIHWLVTDHLGTPRMVFDQTGSLANVSRHDYLPFGEELFAGTGGRTTAQGYASGPNAIDGARQKFTSKERDTETGLDYFGARYFGSTQGRFTGVDPIGVTKYHIENPQLWNGYSYALNNPLIVIDIDGRFPWTIYVRSFIFNSSVGGGLYRGDGRGPSTDTSINTSSRISLNFTLDYDKNQITNVAIRSDPTIFYGTTPPLIKAGSPTVNFEPLAGLGSNTQVDFHYEGNDPVPGVITPDVDVYGKISIAEDKKNNLLSVNASFSGDKYPSTEAFIADSSGKKVFLGAAYEQGDVRNTYGNNKQSLFKVDFKVRFDNKGNFTAVIVGKKTYTIEQWNKKVQAEF